MGRHGSECLVLMKELDTIMDSCKKEATIAKNLLAKLEEENKKFAAANPSSTTTQIRSNLLATNTRSFNTVMRDYQAATESFRDSLRQRIGRQARICTCFSCEFSFLILVSERRHY